MESPKKNRTCQIQELPDEIWGQILLCVPARTVINLKIVCKTWCELINSKHFQTSHVNHWRSKVSETTLQLVTKSYRSELLSLDFGDDVPSKIHCYLLRFDQFFRRSKRRLAVPTPAMNTTVLDCYEGLFLVRCSKHLFLCNPLTNSYRRLPLPKRGVDQACRSHHWTVVSDPSTGEYVIFYVVNMLHSYVVCSLRIDLHGGHGRESDWQQVWSSGNQTPLSLQTLILFFLESISTDGKAHWLFYFKEHDYFFYTGYENTGILTIDAATKESIVTKCSATPSFALSSNFFKSNKNFYCLKESSSRVALELWVLDNLDNPTWSKHHTLDKIHANWMILCDLSGIIKEGNRLIIRYSRDVFIYDMSCKKWHAAYILNDDEDSVWAWGWMSYRYSLLSWN